MNNEKKKGVGAVDFFCIGFGAIVGVGWAVSINSWMTSCGGPIPAALGYLLVLIMMVPIALCYCELVPMYPVAGGGMAFAYKGFNRHIAFLSGWMALGAFVWIVPWEAIQLTDVLGYLFPVLKQGTPLYQSFGSDIHLTTIVLGIGFSLLLYALNMKGLATAAFAQRILCFVLVLSALVGAVAALCGGSTQNLLPVYDTADPSIYGEGLKTVTHRSTFGGCFAIVATAAFFLAGFETIPQGIEDAGGDIKSVGKTVVLSVGLACLFYALLLICFGIGWPWRQFANMPRPAAATMFLSLFPGVGGKLLYWVLILGAIAGLFTTWNGFFTPSANLLMSMGRGKLVFPFFARQNSGGVAVYGQLFVLILSCCGPFLGPNLIDSITSFSGAAFILSWMITAWSLVMCRVRYPDKKRPYRIPGGIATGIFAGTVSSAAFIFMFVPSSPFYIGATAVKMFFGWLAVGLLFYLASFPQRRKLTNEELEMGVFGSALSDAEKEG